MSYSGYSGDFQTTIISGRKRKTPLEWVLEDFETKKSKFPDVDGSVDVLTCRYCAVEIDVLSPGKKA